MSGVRFGIVGFGNIGRTHYDTIASTEVPRGCVTAVVARRADGLPEGVRHFDSLDALLAAGETDAILVATPTMSHPELGRAALEAGQHLVMEKPLAMSAGDAQALVSAVTDASQAAVMLNQRYHPAYRRIQEIVASGQLGPIVRFSWLMTGWYRPEAYFQVSRWRGTWPGEGGGALLNQCIHNLDVLQWVLGMPASVVADARFGKFHQIDVEDEVSALLAMPGGATGTVVMSTGEAPGTNQLEIVGDLGTLRYDGETLALQHAAQSVSEHCATTRNMFSVPEFRAEVVDVGGAVNQHACVLNNVCDSVLDGTALATPLSEGVASVALANAMLMSAWEDRRVHLPLDVQAYQAHLDARIAAHNFREPQDIEVHVDMKDSYR